MKKKEFRERIIVYCDYCNDEIKGTYQTLHAKDKTENHFCHCAKKGEKHNCVVNFRKDQMILLKANREALKNI